MEKVFSFQQALLAGYDPENYKYGKDLLLGEFNVTLNFKIWAKGFTPAVTCFCSINGNGDLIRFNVFRNKEGDYYLKDSNIDMVKLPYGTEFSILVARNSKGNVVVTGIKY